MSERPGFFSSLKRGLRTSAELAEVRLALFATELQQEKLRVLESAAWLALGVLALGAGVMVGSLWLVMLVGEEHRLAALGVLALLYFGAAFLAWWMARARLTSSGVPFQATLAEFRRDRAALLDSGHEAALAAGAETEAARHASSRRV